MNPIYFAYQYASIQHRIMNANDNSDKPVRGKLLVALTKLKKALGL